MSNQINGIRTKRIDLIKYEVIELLEDNKVKEEAISQIVRLMAELKKLAANQKPDYLTEARQRKGKT
ncbi:hypothetical protein [Acinetobacter junii]|uniref:hypothetical protein n=1 Tax=Acinetobacter junii TaxID=40215 RepID=UPI0021CD745B|nr:hypothetical protein [Acinetobacter junii]MCU4406689.1 hypothetical protein [Acinetobacter junii]